MSTPTIDGPQPCTKAELSEVIALVNEALRQGTDQTMLTDYPLVYRDENLPNVQILKVDGQVISVVPFLTMISFLGLKPINENSASFFGPSTDSKR